MLPSARWDPKVSSSAGDDTTRLLRRKKKQNTKKASERQSRKDKTMHVWILYSHSLIFIQEPDGSNGSDWEHLVCWVAGGKMCSASSRMYYSNRLPTVNMSPQRSQAVSSCRCLQHSVAYPYFTSTETLPWIFVSLPPSCISTSSAVLAHLWVAPAQAIGAEQSEQDGHFGKGRRLFCRKRAQMQELIALR